MHRRKEPNMYLCFANFYSALGKTGGLQFLYKPIGFLFHAKFLDDANKKMRWSENVTKGIQLLHTEYEKVYAG